jgi:hypothetical protein
MLHGIQGVYSEALLAGGSLRDHFLGESYNDLDFFVKLRHDQTNEQLHEDMYQAGRASGRNLEFQPHQSELKNYDINFHNVHSVWTANRVQIIVLDLEEVSMETVSTRCDFGICQIGFDGEAMYLDDNFLKDVLDKTFTLHNVSDMESHYKRWCRFRDSGKYKDFKLNSPEMMEWAREEGIDHDITKADTDF